MLRSMSRDDLHERTADRGLLRFDVEPHVWKRCQDLVQRRDGHAPSSKRMDACLVDEPIPRVERLDLLEREVGDRTVAVGRSIDGRIMNDDDLAVLGESDVQLHHVGPP